MNAWLPTPPPPRRETAGARPSARARHPTHTPTPHPQVVAVGPGKTDDDGKTTPVGVKKGDIVLYSRYAGTEFPAPDGSAEYVVIRDADVLATVA